VNVRRTLKDPTVQVRIGLASLALAAVVRRFLHPTAALPADAVDAVDGVLYGIAIAAMLLGLSRGGFRGRPGGAR
jgi:hypothetical protein